MCKVSSTSMTGHAPHPSECTAVSVVSDATRATLTMETARSAEGTTARVQQVAFAAGAGLDAGPRICLKQSGAVLAARASVQLPRSKRALISRTVQTQKAAPIQRWSTKNGSWCKMDNLFLFVVTWVFLLSAAIPTTAIENLGTSSSSNPSAFPPMLSGGGSTKTVTVVAGHHLPPLPVTSLKNDPSATAAYVRDSVPPAVAAPASFAALTTPVSKIDLSSGEESGAMAASKAVTSGGLSPALVSAVLVRFAAAWAQHETVVKTLLAGAMSGVVSRTCTSPLEVLATLQMSGFGQAGTSMTRQLGSIYATQGAAGFFRGNGANCLKVAPTRAIQFAVYERLKRWLVEQQKLKNARAGLDPKAPVSLPPQQRLVAGGLAGMCACSVVYPLEVVKTMLTVNPGMYSGIGGAFQHAFKEGGVSGFYKGWLPTMFAMFPYVGVEFMIYECGKKAYARQVARTQGPSADALPTLVHLFIGALAGMASQTAAHPLDVVRRRLQMQGKQGAPAGHANMFYCLYSLATEEGIRSLYRGLKPACAEKVPSTAITFFAYGVFKKLLGLSSI